jgi:hypothetical protein
MSANECGRSPQKFFNESRPMSSFNGGDDNHFAEKWQLAARSLFWSFALQIIDGGQCHAS